MDPILPELVLLEGRDFLMGSDSGGKDERPAHWLRLPPFRAARAPVTNAEYLRFVQDVAAPLPPYLHDRRFNPPDQPVVGVSWLDATAYCAWLSERTSIPCRLPTEAERELAARGGVPEADWPWSVDGRHPLFEGIAALNRPHVPGLECANRYGLRCMADNVHEWCSDWYDAGYYAIAPGESPAGPPVGFRRSARGGSWRHAIKFTRVTARSSLDPSFRYNDFGFRVFADA